VSTTVDANLLLYASDEGSPFHARAFRFLDELARGTTLVYLFWPTVLAYLRIATHPSIFASPLSTAAALGNVEGLLRLPHVQTTGERDRFWTTFQGIATDASVSGNLVSDAQLVALMLENGVRTIWTNDRDFRRFDGIEARDPFA
jgi:toxin-antitoxin system PIN domain toxin